MIWADRLGICLGILWVIWYAAADAQHAGVGAGLIVFVVAPWLLARFLHFIFTGRIGPRGRHAP